MKGNLAALCAFTVTSGDISVPVFATSASDAKTVALTCEWFESNTYMDLRAKREPRLDAYAETFGRIYFTFDTPEQERLVRSIGWRQLEWDETPCAKCGLYAWSLLPESAIGEAGMCGECSPACNVQRTANGVTLLAP